MGKAEEQQLPLHRRQVEGNRSWIGSSIFCERCSAGLSTIGGEFNLKCFLILVLSASVFLSAIFWLLPLRPREQYGFDAKEAVKLSAPVQAYFKLKKPISLLIPQIARLEYDINGEIGVPFTKVAVLSMHRASVSNWTNVVFGLLPDTMNASISTVSLSVLRSSLIELFLQQTNLTLTTSIFGQPSSFEILKFPGGITIIPEQSASIWQIPQILFNFTLNNSIYEIKQNFVELKEQLKLGLHLRPYENVYVQVTNSNGSTKDPPVIVDASVVSEIGSLLPQRLKQLAQTITGSPPTKNLGLDNSIFGKVKEISLSSYMNRTLRATPPTPSPAPSPVDSPAPSPVDSPAPAPNSGSSPPCDNCEISSPAPQKEPVFPLPPPPSRHCGSEISPAPTQSPPKGPAPQVSPGLSPLPAVSYGSSPGLDRGKGKVNGNGNGSVSSPLSSPSMAPAYDLTSFSLAPSFNGLSLFTLFGLLTFNLLCW